MVCSLLRQKFFVTNVFLINISNHDFFLKLQYISVCTYSTYVGVLKKKCSNSH